jgi:putative SOS response-associated peptidase YedK
MCYYSLLKSNTKDMVREFDAIFPRAELFKPIYSASAFAFPKMPVINSDTPGEISLFQWGLIPFWVKNINQANSIRQWTLNARSETIFEKPAFRQAIRSRRCLVIVDGFFEWRHVEKKKYPYYITLKSRAIFTLAGIWDTWSNPDSNEKLDTFSVVTTEANELMAKVHNSRKRMPLILPKEKEKTWLDPEQNEAQIKGIMVPYNTNDMKAYTITNRLSRLGYNTTGRTITAPFEYQELPTLE